MNTDKPTEAEVNKGTDTDKLLDPDQREAIERITKSEAPHNQRAQAILALDEGMTQAEAGQRAGLTSGQVKYWLGKFRKEGLGIFPEELYAEAEQQEEPAALVTESIVETESKAEKPKAEDKAKKTKSEDKPKKKDKSKKKKAKKNKKPKKSKKAKKAKGKKGKSSKKPKKK
jgi:transposase-like protein